MIKIWKQKEAGNGIVHSAILERNCWLQVVNPTPLEIESLQREYRIAPDVINDILDVDERSRYEREDDQFLIIFRAPLHLPGEEVPYQTIPLGIILMPGVTITISLKELDFLSEFTENRVRGLALEDQNAFVLHLFQRAATRYLRYLKEINRQSTGVERDLQKSIKNNELVHLLRLEKSLVFFTTSLKSNELLFDKLLKTRFKNLTEKQEDLLDDVLTESKQAVETANIYSNILSGMMDAFASVISNNLNTVLKRLTVISIVLMIPTLYASLYGMNVPLPLQHTPWAFPGIVAVSLLSSILGGLFISRNRSFR